MSRLIRQPTRLKCQVKKRAVRGCIDLTKRSEEDGSSGQTNFIVRLVDRRLEKEVSEHHVARERSESDEELAERIVRAGMKELDWEEKGVRWRPKSDPGKISLARELRRRTSIDLKWTAQRLEMGSWSHVYKLVAIAKSAKNED